MYSSIEACGCSIISNTNICSLWEFCIVINAIFILISLKLSASIALLYYNNLPSLHLVQHWVQTAAITATATATKIHYCLILTQIPSFILRCYSRLATMKTMGYKIFTFLNFHKLNQLTNFKEQNPSCSASQEISHPKAQFHILMMLPTPVLSQRIHVNTPQSPSFIFLIKMKQHQVQINNKYCTYWRRKY
jgi:hypothetical protein